MARIRTIKPDFFKDEKIADLPPTTRLFFVGLWLLADREGRLENRPRYFRAELFPYDFEFDAVAHIKTLIDAGLLVPYSVDAREYLEIKNFKKHQVINNRESSSNIPGRRVPDACPTRGYVYAAIAKGVSKIKIGFSERDPKKRGSDLSTGSPIELDLLYSVEAERHKETELHRLLSDFHDRREWFEITEESRRVVDAWFTRYDLDQGEGKGKEGKGKERKGKERKGREFEGREGNGEFRKLVDNSVSSLGVDPRPLKGPGPSPMSAEEQRAYAKRLLGKGET